jgi:hypothetical protein
MPPIAKITLSCTNASGIEHLGVLRGALPVTTKFASIALTSFDKIKSLGSSEISTPPTMKIVSSFSNWQVVNWVGIFGFD